MSKNTNLSFLTDYITADITNGRIGINNTSPAYAFDVTGVAKFSSSITAAKIITSTTLDGDPQLGVFTNASTGTSAEATIYIRNGTTSNDATFLQTLGTGFTTTGGFVQDGGTLGTGTGLSGGLSLIVRANADMRFYTNGHTNERMRITSAGNVGIGLSSTPDKLGVQGTANNWTGKFLGSTVSGNSFGVDIVAGTTDGDYPLYVRTTNYSLRLFIRGDGYCYIGASSWAYGSDLRMKENISDVINGLDLVSKLKPKHFDYINGAKNNLGFIAQEVQELIPQAVSISDEKTGMLALKTDFIIPYLVKAIQELSEEITILKNK